MPRHSCDNRLNDAMHIVNRSRIHEATVTAVALRSHVADREFLLFLDDAVNTARADLASAKLEEHRQKGLKFTQPTWEKEATGENDHHACTVTKATIATEKLPAKVIAAIGSCNLLVYLDATWTGKGEIDFVLTLAHELRHTWQYFNAPIVYHSQAPLSFVVQPQLTPCELDAEKAAKRVLCEEYGEAAVREYLKNELARCRSEHRETVQRLAELDITADRQMETGTIELLKQHAAEIVSFQTEARSRFPGYVMPGVRELTEALKGRSNIRLLP